MRKTHNTCLRAEASAAVEMRPRLGPAERAVLAAGFLAIALAIVVPPNITPHRNPGLTAGVLVGRGDTLWSIAAECAGPTRDARRSAREIMAMNGLASPALTPGSVLRVPARPR